MILSLIFFIISMYHCTCNIGYCKIIIYQCGNASLRNPHFVYNRRKGAHDSLSLLHCHLYEYWVGKYLTVVVFNFYTYHFFGEGRYCTLHFFSGWVVRCSSQASSASRELWLPLLGLEPRVTRTCTAHWNVCFVEQWEHFNVLTFHILGNKTLF